MTININQATIKASITLPDDYQAEWAENKAETCNQVVAKATLQWPSGVHVRFSEGAGPGCNYVMEAPIKLPLDRVLTIDGQGVATISRSNTDGSPVFILAGTDVLAEGRMSRLVIKDFVDLASENHNVFECERSPSGQRPSLHRFRMENCVVSASNGCGLFFPDIGYSRHPAIRGNDFRGAGGVYVSGESYTMSQLDYHHNHHHAGSNSGGQDRRQIFPDLYLNGCQLTCISQVTCESGGNTPGDAGFRPTMPDGTPIDPDSPDRRKTLGIYIRNPGPRGGEATSIHHESYAPEGYRDTAIVQEHTGGGPNGVGNFHLVDVPFSGLMLDSPIGEVLIVDLAPSRIGQAHAPATMEVLGGARLEVRGGELSHLAKSQLVSAAVKYSGCWWKGEWYNSADGAVTPGPGPVPIPDPVFLDAFAGPVTPIEDRPSWIRHNGLIFAGNGEAAGSISVQSSLARVNLPSVTDVMLTGSVAGGSPYSVLGLIFGFVDGNTQFQLLASVDTGSVRLYHYANGGGGMVAENDVTPGTVPHTYRVYLDAGKVVCLMDGKEMFRVPAGGMTSLGPAVGLRLGPGDVASSFRAGGVAAGTT